MSWITPKKDSFILSVNCGSSVPDRQTAKKNIFHTSNCFQIHLIIAAYMCLG